MKKSLIALAALSTLAGVAQAQSSVTLYGAIGASSNKATLNNVDAATAFQGTSDDYLGTTALGLRGTEDLGGGLSAFFNLEGDLSGSGQIGGTIGSTSTSTYTGTAVTVVATAVASVITTATTSAGTVSTSTTTKQSIFNRQAHVGITSKDFGTISVGRQNDSIKDLEGLSQVYNLSDNLHFNTLVGNRYAQIYKYATPTINGLKASYSYSNATENTTSDTADGTKTLNSYALSYQTGNYQFGAASGKISEIGQNDQQTTIYGARAIFGNLTVGAGYNANKQGDNKLNQTIVSANYAMGKIDLKGHYVTNDQTGSAMSDGSSNATARYDGKGYGLMGVYNLSKRTAAYAGYADFDATAGTTYDQKVTTIGLFHRF
jgi:predicted porin